MTDRITLTELLNEKNAKVVKRQQASMVSPAYRGKPKNEQIMSGVTGVEEIKLSNKETVFICVDDELVFATANGANSHRATAHSKKKTNNIQVEIVPAKKAAPNSVATRQKNIVKATTTEAARTKSLTSTELLEKLRTAEDKYRKEFDEWCKAMETKNAEVANLTRANNFLQASLDQLHQQYNLLERACETLRKDVKELEKPTQIESRFISLVESAIENLKDKYATIQMIQADATARAEEILNPQS